MKSSIHDLFTSKNGTHNNSRTHTYSILVCTTIVFSGSAKTPMRILDGASDGMSIVILTASMRSNRNPTRSRTASRAVEGSLTPCEPSSCCLVLLKYAQYTRPCLRQSQFYRWGWSVPVPVSRTTGAGCSLTICLLLAMSPSKGR